MSSGKSKPPVPPKPTALLSDLGFRKPVLTVSPLSGAAPHSSDADGRLADDAAEDPCNKDGAHKEITVVLEHTVQAEVLCNGSNDAMPATNDANDTAPGCSGTRPSQNGDSGASPLKKQTRFTDDSKRNTITEDWTLNDNVESGDEVCCTRLSLLIHRKAKELSSHLTKPPKPPKPAKDCKTIERETSSRPRSFGDEIPGGKHGIRYVDEDTEASSDYQDLDLSRLAIAEVTTISAAVHGDSAVAKPAVVVENEYEIVEAPREEIVASTPPPVAPIFTPIVSPDISCVTPVSVVPEQTQKKTRSLEKPKRPPPPKPESVAKSHIKFGVRVMPCGPLHKVTSEEATVAAQSETAVDSSRVHPEECKRRSMPVKGKGISKVPLVGRASSEKRTPREPTVMPLSAASPSRPISPSKKPRPQRPPPPKVPPSVPSKGEVSKSVIVETEGTTAQHGADVSVSPNSQICGEDAVNSSLDGGQMEAKSLGVPLSDSLGVELPVTAQPETQVTLKLEVVVTSKSEDVETPQPEASITPQPEAVVVTPLPSEPLLTELLERLEESPKTTKPPEGLVKSPKMTETPRKKRTPPPRPPPPRCKLKTPEAPASAQNLNEYCQTDDLIEVRAKHLVENLDALLSLKEAEEVGRKKDVECIEDSLKTMAREVIHGFRKPDDDDIVCEACEYEGGDQSKGKGDSSVGKGGDQVTTGCDKNFIVKMEANCKGQGEAGTSFEGQGDVPRAPPRSKRRQRSRTVEAVRSPRLEQQRSRSHSLSEMDVRIRAAQRLGEPSDIAATITETFVMVVESPLTQKELKALYSNIAASPQSKERCFKEPPRPTPTTGMRFRPLPAPPPPPRGKLKSPAPPIPAKLHHVTKVSSEKTPEGDQGACGDETKNERVTGEHLGSEGNPGTSETPIRRASVGAPDPLKSSEHTPTPQRSESMGKRTSRGGDSSSKIRWSVDQDADSAKESTEGRRLSNSTFYTSPLEIPPEAQRGAESPNTEPNTSERSRSSWYDDSDASGDVADVDSPAVPSDTDPAASRKSDSSPGSVHRSKCKSKEKKRPSSKFYCEMEGERGSSTEGEVSRSTSRMSGMALASDEGTEVKAEDTDELLEMAEGLQKEMKQVLVERQKRLLESFDSELSAQMAAERENKEPREAGGRELSPSSMPRKDLQSIHSSASEVSWQGTSDEESDGEETCHMSLDEATRYRRRRKLFYIAQELASSEQVFVDALHLLNQDFREAVHMSGEEKSAPVVPEEVLEQILKHLPQLQELNERLLGQLRERVDNWEGNERVADVLVKMGPFLKLYSSYIKDFEAATAALEDAKRKFPNFLKVVTKFEQSPRCRQLTLQQYMLKPIQRIPQYKLLLRDYVNHLAEDSPDYKDACTALNIVTQVAQHANESMKLGDNFSKLMSIQNSIVNHHEVIKPGRNFLKEGELMKISRKEMQPRLFILFSDSLLCLTAAQQGGYRVNLELPLSDMKVNVPPQQDYQNEFSIITRRRSFLLSASSPKEREEWISALNQAIEDNINRKSSFHVLRKEGSESSSSSELGREAPVWIPDQRVTMCQLCTSGFTFTHRRHHCRACGKVVCAACSSNKLPLQYKGSHPVRVCDDCFLSLRSGEMKEKPELDFDGDQGLAKKKKTSRGILQEVPANDLGSSMSGYLHQWWKRAWKRQWFVIKDHVLYIYRASEDVAALRTIPLLGFQVRPVDKGFEDVPRDQLFELVHTGLEPVTFHADSPALAARWRTAMEEATMLS